MQLSERQQQTIATALTIIAALVIVFAVLGLFWVLAIFVQTFSSVLLPLAVAGIVALVFQPYYDWLHSRMRLPTPVAVAALFLSILIPIGLFAGFFGVVIVRELVDFFRQLPVWWDDLLRQLDSQWPEVKAFFSDNPVGQRVAQMLNGLGPMMAAGLEYFATTSMQATASLAGWTGAMLSWAVAPVYFVFFLVMKRQDVSQLEDYLPFLKEGTRKDVMFLVREFVTIVVTFFRGQIIIAFLQGLLLASGFSIVGLQYGLVLGFLLGFLNVIPYLGSMLGLVITLPLAYFQDEGGMLTLVGVIVVLTIVQTIEGYLLTPKIMGERTGLHPMVIIFAVFFWGSALGGILGMILAIPLTAFLVVCWRLAKEKYISELV
jgi:predicted PurR-regulated permease PerM